jgi:hypothetical protein
MMITFRIGNFSWVSVKLLEVAMRSFVLACIAVAVIALMGAALLNVIQESATEAFSTNAVRL